MVSVGEIETKNVSIAKEIRPTVGKWYAILRNTAIVASLTILIYIGIKIIISTNAADKSKYKQRLLDWVVSICLIFIMHYIMVGSNVLIKKISKLVEGYGALDSTYIYQFQSDAQRDNVAAALISNKAVLKEGHLIEDGWSDEDIKNQFITRNGDWDYLVWPTNLMGMIRMQAQEQGEIDKGNISYIGYTIIMGVLVIFTISFIFTYFRRIIYLAFLTIIAPFVAMTYAIDKLKDGSAQGFNAWFKEYMINLIIQPVHLLLYTVLISSAIDLARTNVLYSVVAIGFMIPAEKLVRRFFGFNATETQGLLSGPAGAALMMTGLNRVFGHKPPKREEKKKEDDEEKVRQYSPKSNRIFRTSEQNNMTYDIASEESSNNNIPTRNNETTTSSISNGRNANTENNLDSTSMEFGQEELKIAKEDWESEQAKITANKKDRQKAQQVAQENANRKSKQNTQQVNQENAYRKARQDAYYRAKKSGYQGSFSKSNNNNQNTLENDSKTKQPSRLKKVMNRTISGYKSAAKNSAKKVAEKVLTNPGEKLTKLGSRIGMGVLGGTIGAIATVASGEPNNFIRNVGGGAIAGGAFGSAVGDVAYGRVQISSDNVYETEKEEARRIKQRKRQLLNDDEYIRKVAKKLNKKTLSETRELLDKDGFLEEAIRYGYDQNATDLAVARKATEGTSKEERETAWAWAEYERNNASAISGARHSAKNEKELTDTLLRDVRENNPMIDNNEVNAIVEQMKNRLYELDDIRMRS